MAFIRQVRLLSRKKIPENDADLLIKYANKLIIEL